MLCNNQQCLLAKEECVLKTKVTCTDKNMSNSGKGEGIYPLSGNVFML